MTLNEVIHFVDTVKPNAIDEDAKVAWVLQMDQRVYRDLTGKDLPDTLPVTAEEPDRELLAAPPHDNIYTLYVQSMVEFSLAEYESYNNTALLFTDAWAEYRAWYRRNHRPAPVGWKGVL